MIYVHRLNGCAPAPLAHYLKALGVLRIVSDQLDPEARGFWEGEGFVLISSKTDKELVAFFLQRYKPTPILNPWGARSGFYPGSSERTSREVLQEIAKAPDERFSDFRIAIATTADTGRREHQRKARPGPVPQEQPSWFRINVARRRHRNR
jgi:CRISPR-associated protein Csx17